MQGEAGSAGGAVLVLRLHRLVRQGWRPWLGYDRASGLDRDIALRRRRAVARLAADGGLRISAPGAADVSIAAGDAAGFDARFSPDAPNRRSLMRRLYEIGV